MGKFRLFCGCVMVLILAAGRASAQPAGHPVGGQLQNSVVKIFVTTQAPDFLRPWSVHDMKSRSGSGTIIEGERILTSAHVVADHTFIEVRKHGDPQKYTAFVETVGHECDLAILKVREEGFFQGTRPVELGGLPDLKDQVTVIGYPIGGDQISITQGIVSRIEVMPYTHSLSNLLAVQIDAAINAGNSGGPVVQNGKLVGVAFQGMRQAQSIGYLVPVPVIKHFFKDLEDGEYHGFPDLGFVNQKMENESLREYHRIRRDEGGVLITKIMPDTPVSGKVQEGDVLLAIDGVPIARDGTVRLRDNARVSFAHILHQKQVDDPVELEVSRKGTVRKIGFRLGPVTRLVPRPHYFEKPVYYIYGGLVFTVLSMDLLKRGLSNGLGSFLNLHYYAMGPGQLRLDERENIPLLVNVLPDAANIGYHELSLQVVDEINGQFIRSFEELVTRLHEAGDEYVEIGTEQFSRIILENRNIDTVNRRILEKYAIPSLYSGHVESWLDDKSPVLNKRESNHESRD